MATIIDALVVTLGLDSKGFRQGSKDAEKSLKDTRENADKTAKDLEAKGKKAAEFFKAVKVEALSLLAIFTAGVGLKAFASDAMSSSAQLQNLSGNLQQSASEMRAWEKTFERAGATAGDATALLAQAATDIGRVNTGQGISEALIAISRGGGNINEALKGPREFVMEQARVLERLNAIDPNRARALSQMMGLNDAQFAVMKRGPAALQEQVAIQQKLIGLTDEQIARLARLNTAWTDFKTSLEGIANTILTRYSSDIEGALSGTEEKFERLSSWVQQNKDGIIGFFVALGVAIGIPMAPTLALIAAVASMAAGVGYLYEQWKVWTNGGKTELDGFFEFFVKVWEAIKALFVGTSDDIRRAWGDLFDDIENLWDGLISMFQGSGPSILDAFKRGLEAAFGWAEGRVKAIWDALTGGSSAGEVAANIEKRVEQTGAAASDFIGGLADSMFGKLIAKGEGDYNSVNRGKAGGYKAGTEDLENMTVAEVMAAQRSGKFNAAGRYQIIRGTLWEAFNDMGLTGDEKFDKGMQDRIFEEYLVKHKRKAIGDYLNGKSDDIMAAAYAMAKEWASVAVPAGMRTESGAVSDGRMTYYDRSGKNKASTSADDAMAALRSGRMLPIGARALGPSGSPVAGNNSSEVNIQQMTIQTQATDAQGIARDARAAFAKHPLIVPQANNGLS